MSKQKKQKTHAEPREVEALAPDIDEQEKILREQGYQTLRQERGDSTYLMQQYYMVFLTPGENINQDSTEVEELQNQHLGYLDRLVVQEHASLMGQLGEESIIKEVVIFNTALKERQIVWQILIP